jgi:multidrug efflux pump
VFKITPEVQGKVSSVPGIRTFAAAPPALPGGGQFPVEFVIGATAEPDVILRYADMIQTNAAASGMFAFPPTIDTKIDQPEMELIMDRDKVAALGLNMATVGADLSTLVGGNFVNRFSLDGRSYKVIPQIKRVERLNASQLSSFCHAAQDDRAAHA